MASFRAIFSSKSPDFGCSQPRTRPKRIIGPEPGGTRETGGGVLWLLREATSAAAMFDCGLLQTSYYVGQEYPSYPKTEIGQSTRQNTISIARGRRKSARGERPQPDTDSLRPHAYHLRRIDPATQQRGGDQQGHDRQCGQRCGNEYGNGSVQYD